MNPETDFWVCSRRSCGWTGTLDQKASEVLVPGRSWILKCPRCGNESFYEELPLFIPLKRKHFEDFEAGTKPEEYRPLGARWNEKTCHVGRRVTLSLGYGKRRRLSGVITSFRVELDPKEKLPGWEECYGNRHAVAACIGIKLENQKMIDLKLFCSNDTRRQILLNPWTLGRYTYATCGRNIIRVPMQDDIPERHDAPRVDNIGFPDQFAKLTLRKLVLPLEWPAREKSDCSVCNKSGLVMTCPKCHGDGELLRLFFNDESNECPDCKGKGVLPCSPQGDPSNCPNCNGKGFTLSRLEVRIGEAKFNYDVIEHVLRLPGLKVVPGDSSAPTYFTFDVGDGLIMPLRYGLGNAAIVTLQVV